MQDKMRKRNIQKDWSILRFWHGWGGPGNQSPHRYQGTTGLYKEYTLFMAPLDWLVMTFGFLRVPAGRILLQYGRPGSIPDWEDPGRTSCSCL